MTVFAIGYGGRKPEEFTALLKRHAIRTVVDVRLRPDRASMGCYTKAKSRDKGIQKLLAEAGIGYVSIVELGNLFVDLPDWRDRYEKLLAVAGDLLTSRLADVLEPYCLICAEKRVSECHREAIAAFLATKGHTIEHLE